MGLEHIENICMNFLRQTTNPLVPVDMLYDKCSEGGTSGLTREALLNFLRNHAEVLVVDSAETAGAIDPSDLSGAGINIGPRAILKSRVPTRAEMQDMLQQQLDRMRALLKDAIKQAKDHQDGEAVEELEAALERSNKIEEQMRSFMEHKAR